MSYFVLGLLVLLAIPTVVGIALVTLSAMWIRNLSRQRRVTQWVDNAYPDKDCIIRQWCLDNAKDISPIINHKEKH